MTPNYGTNVATVAMVLSIIAAPALSVYADSIAGGDVLARCQSIVSGTAESATSTPSFVTFPETSVPKDIAAALDAKSIQWEALSDPMRIGLLWAFGYVLPGAEDGVAAQSSLLFVYTDCSGEDSAQVGTNEAVLGVPMNAIEISPDSLKATSCTQNQCGGIYKANNTACISAKLESTIQCAIKSDNLPATAGSFWSSASGSSSMIPYPQIYFQNISTFTSGSDEDGGNSSVVDSGNGSSVDEVVGGSRLSLVTIQMQKPDGSVECSSTADAVIPCLAIDTFKDRKFCRPKLDQASLDVFFDTIVQKTSKEVSTTVDGGADSGGLSIGAIIGIVGGALVVLGLVAFYFFRSGKKPAPRKESGEDPMYIGLGAKGHNLNKTHSTNFPMIDRAQDNDTVNSTDMYAVGSGGGGGGGQSIMDDSMHNQPSGRPFFPSNASDMSSQQRVSSVSSRGAPYGKTDEDYMDESDILREFLTDPHILVRRIPHDELTTLRILSKGSYGEVYLGQLETRHVAMKRLLPEKRHLVRSMEQFTGEIRLMTHLEHRNIVSFIGVSWDYVPNICAVVEYMDNGDLAEVLAKSKGKLTWPKEKISISMDIAEGLVYLHSMRPVIVHRDLKSKNVLLNKRGQAKLSDFGVSRKTTVNETMTSGVGTLLWTAPEIIEGRKYSEKADIFSLGVVLSEIDTGEEPYASMKNDTNNERLPGMQIVQMVRLGQLKVRFRDDCPAKVRELAEQCTSLDPDMRPTSMEVAYTLKSIVAPMLRR